LEKSCEKFSKIIVVIKHEVGMLAFPDRMGRIHPWERGIRNIPTMERGE
jgi:hypothetical protein